MAGVLVSTLAILTNRPARAKGAWETYCRIAVSAPWPLDVVRETDIERVVRFTTDDPDSLVKELRDGGIPVNAITIEGEVAA